MSTPINAPKTRAEYAAKYPMIAQHGVSGPYLIGNITCMKTRRDAFGVQQPIPQSQWRWIYNVKAVSPTKLEGLSYSEPYHMGQKFFTGDVVNAVTNDYFIVTLVTPHVQAPTPRKQVQMLNSSEIAEQIAETIEEQQQDAEDEELELEAELAAGSVRTEQQLAAFEAEAKTTHPTKPGKITKQPVGGDGKDLPF